jgi:ribosome-associated heat shock protein Hsp15
MEVRADTYLWAVRMYRSRTLASEAMKGGKVKLNHENVKPAHLVKVGERYTLTIGHTRKIIEVTALVDRRGNFEFAKKFYADHSPEPEKKGEVIPSAFFKVNIAREKGAGRPTKKDRRDQDDLWGN